MYQILGLHVTRTAVSRGSPPAGCGGMRSLGRAELQFVGFVPCPIAAIDPIAPPGVSAPLCAHCPSSSKVCLEENKANPSFRAALHTWLHCVCWGNRPLCELKSDGVSYSSSQLLRVHPPQNRFPLTRNPTQNNVGIWTLSYSTCRGSCGWSTGSTRNEQGLVRCHKDNSDL